MILNNSFIVLVALLIINPAIALAQEDFTINIKLSEFKLILSGKEGNLSEFVIATPRVTPKQLPIEAIVTSVELNPYWHPTSKTREAYRNQRKIILPEIIAPGDLRNAMGQGIIRLRYLTPNMMDPNVVIHGTNDELSIGKNVTRGCVRMYNKDIVRLIEIIRKRNTKVIFEK